MFSPRCRPLLKDEETVSDSKIQYSMRDVKRPWRSMGAVRFLTTLYAIVFVVMILIAIGSLLGLFSNPMIDPGV